MQNVRMPSLVSLAITLITGLLLLGGAYWGVSAYLNINVNNIAVAAASAFASVFIVGAIFIMVANGFSQMNAHLEHISDMADEQVKLLRYLAKQAQKDVG